MRPSITALTILSLIAFSPSGYAQQAGSKENPLSGTQTDRIVAPDSTDIYVSGDVIFADMTSSDSVGGAAIGVGTANKNTDPIVVRILGATEGKQDNLSFINNAIENKWNLGGAVGSKEMTYPITIAFENLNQLIFYNNRIEGGLYNQPCGGGSVGAQTIVFKDINTVSISGIYDGESKTGTSFTTEEINATYGGALRGYTLIVDNVDSFSVCNTLTYGNSSGNGAISIGKTSQAESVISNCGQINISNNALIYDGTFSDYTRGSAIEIGRNNLSIYGNDFIRINDNYGSKRATVFVYEDNDGYRGRFDCYLNKGFEFSGNTAGEHMAGIELFMVGYEFRDDAGAIVQDRSSNGRIMLSADYGDMVFRNNIGCLENLPFNFATSVIFTGSLGIDHTTAGDFRAMEGQYIHFYDPVRVWTTPASNGQVVRIDLNKVPDAADPRNTEVIANYEKYMGEVPEFKGTIRFSGEYYRGTNSPYLTQADGESSDDFALRLLYSRWSDVVADTYLWDGELLIENGAIYGNGDDTLNCQFVYKNGDLTLSEEAPNATWEFHKDTSLMVQKGALTLRSDGMAIAKNIVFSGHDAVLRSDDTGRVIADRVDMSRGLSVDFNHALQYGVRSGQTAAGLPSQLISAPLTITANFVDMGSGFVLGVPDHMTETPGAFYSDDAWKSDMSFAVMDVSKVIDKTGLTTDISIVSVASLTTVPETGGVSASNVVEYEGGYSGEWSIRWGDSDDEDDRYVLYADWKSTGSADDGPTTVDPARVGFITENSLWSTHRNTRLLAESALSQVTAFRFEDHRATRFWASGLGEFESVRSKGGVDGYDYSGAGYALGADRVWGGRYLAGIGFGQMYGTNTSRSYPDEVEQVSNMVTLYAAATQKLSDRVDVTYSGSATYGWTDNDLSSWQRAGYCAHGHWNSDALLLKVNAQWNRRLNERAMLGVALGLEYGYAGREAFSESGAEGRHFDDSSLAMLSMPVRASWSYEADGGNTPWLHALSISYIPDLYREDPRSTARDATGWWEVRGASPGRHAFKFSYDTQWFATDSCMLYAGYSFELRDSANYHHVHAGVSVAF